MEGKPKAGFIITRIISGTKLGSDVRAALDEYELPVLEAETVQRQVYPRSAATGLTVFARTIPRHGRRSSGWQMKSCTFWRKEKHHEFND